MSCWPHPNTRPSASIAPLILTALIITLATIPAVAADTITVVSENGRTVYVNDEDSAPKQAAPREIPAKRSSELVYWSNTEHTWKPVPAPSRSAYSAARNAAAEVSKYVAAQPIVKATPAYGNPNYRRLASGRQVTAEEIDKAITEAAERHNVDPNLVRAIIKVESNYNNNAVSRTGAMGLMQLMPQTARTLSVNNPFDPRQNVDAGVRHLKKLLTNYGGNVQLSLAAYNAGEGAVARSNGVPPFAETRNYVRKIAQLYGGGFTPSYAPIRVERDASGVVKFTNTE
jgi:soluble lytic murein transglycosylase-like protein